MTTRLLVATVGLAAALFGQDIEGIPQMDWDGAGPRPTIEGDLLRAGYGLSEQALLTALHDSRPAVRSLAVQKIAEEGWKDAIPSILNALSSETALGTRLWLANGLSKLGNEKGTQDIVETCNTQTLPADFRLTAAAFALESHNLECNGVVIEALHSALDHETGLTPEREMNRVSFIYSLLDGRLTEFLDRSTEIRRCLEESIVAGPKDSLKQYRDGVRIAAINALATFGDSGSLEKLRRALPSETGATMQQRIRASIEKLEEKADSGGTGGH